MGRTNSMGTSTPDMVAWLCHAGSTVYDTVGGTMSEYGRYRVKAKCMVVVYQDFMCDGADKAVDLAIDAVDEWNVYSLDEVEVKRVLEIERLD